jgi:hypothetical protein
MRHPKAFFGIKARPPALPSDFRDAELNREAAAYQQVWIHEIQPKLLRLSTRGRQIVVPNGTHSTIPKEVIISAIHQVVAEVRGGGANH